MMSFYITGGEAEARMFLKSLKVHPYYSNSETVFPIHISMLMSYLFDRCSPWLRVSEVTKAWQNTRKLVAPFGT